MIKKVPQKLFAAIAMLSIAYCANAQSPTAPAQGFNVFAEGNLALTTNESEGPVACGGDLTLKGNYQVAIHNAGNFTVGGVKIGLLVGGKVIYQSGNALQIGSNAYVKIGNNTGSYAWYYDQNNAASPIRITPSSNYDSSPRIMLQASAPNLGVSSANNPVFQSNLLDFSSAFQTMRAKSLSISMCTGNAQLTNPNGQSIPTTNLPGQVKINLQDGINYLNVSGSDMNNVQIFTYNQQPSASKILVINVNAPGTFNWNVWNQSGVSFQSCPYIIYNFYNTTQLNIQGGNAVEGTIFAPFAGITKTANQANIEGQVIAKSFEQAGGEVHYASFAPTVSGCAPPPGVAPTASFGTNNTMQCYAGNSYLFTNNSNTGTAVQPEAPITYLWNFGDGTTSTAMSPSKTYAAAGTYTVTLTATNTYGTNTTTTQVTVYPTISANITQANAGSGPGSITKQLTLTNAASYTSYSWSVTGGGTGLYPNQPVANFTFTAAGYYEVTLTATDANGCSYTTVVPVIIASDDVNTGNNGGLESESLGDAVSKQYIHRKMASTPTLFAKTDANRFEKAPHNMTARNANSELTMADMVPSQLVAGDVAHITSPTDILDYTVAQEVLSVDFSQGEKTKGVVLGVRTVDKVYNHTKASCDRLRGAEIMVVKPVQIDGYNFLMQAIKQRNGVTEYAISFAIGKNAGQQNYTLQTNWYVKEYIVSNNMYNFQVWTTVPENTQKLVRDILNNLRAALPLQQTEVQKLPKTYAAKVSREGTDLVLKLKSQKEDQCIEIAMDENYSETHGYTMRYNPINSEINQDIRLDIKDAYEFDGLITVDGAIQDAFYHADGNWGLDYDSHYTTINSYSVYNDFDRIYQEDELAINRNVKINAHSEYDYLTLYKSLLPAQLPADYTEYGFLSFKAKGSGLMELGLIKSSIENWNQQYRANVNVRATEETYYVPFSYFKSSGTNGTITADDLTMIAFNFLPVAAGTNNLDLTIEDVKFTKTAPEGYKELLNTMKNEFVMYPNPSNGTVNCLLYSDVATEATITLHDITGKLIFTAPVNLTEGRNELKYNFNFPDGGLMFFNISSGSNNYGSCKVMFK